MHEDDLHLLPQTDDNDEFLTEDEHALFTVERRMKIAELIRTKKMATVAEITERLGASPATVRRDLLWLAQQGLIVRTRGGALALDHISQTLLRRTAPSYEGRLNEQVDEKKALGRLAAESIAEGEIIMLDASSTNRYLLPYLSQKRELTVITNSLDITTALLALAEENPGLTVVCSGGTLFLRTHSFIGMTAETALAQFFVDKAFIGVRGLSVQYGITSPFLEEIAVKRQMMRAAREVFVLADHTKFNQTFAGLIAPLSAVHTIITDEQVDVAALQAMREAGPRVQIAPRVQEASSEDIGPETDRQNH